MELISSLQPIFVAQSPFGTSMGLEIPRMPGRRVVGRRCCLIVSKGGVASAYPFVADGSSGKESGEERKECSENLECDDGSEELHFKEEHGCRKEPKR